MEGELTLRVERDGAHVRLLSPDVGLFTCARTRGAVLVPGAEAGFLLALGHSRRLVVPEGVSGVVRGEAPELVHAPVGFGSVLYELDPLASAGPETAAHVAQERAAGPLVFRSPQTGRFWQRSSPAEPPLAQAGDVLAPGTAVGLIEVMKSFTHVLYRSGGPAALPERARIVRVLVQDGADVSAGDPLYELEPA